MKRLRSTVMAALALHTVGAVAQPIELHPENPHYFRWREKPAILLTSGEHYGAVLNLDFDYERYLDELKAHGFNLTRIFSGVYREAPGSFNITGNTLAPASGRFICPWERSASPGALDGRDKFDLTRWDEAYFDRLKDFIRQAGERGVIVELVFFCTMYDDQVWEASPMHPHNNINDIGSVSKHEIYGAADTKLFRVQQAVVRKIVTELNTFDNLYYEICNEPYERGGLTSDWNDGIISTIVEAESSLPKKHLIAQGFPRSAAAIPAFDPRVSVLNFHAEEADAVRLNYSHNRVIAFDESGGTDRSDGKYRIEGWDWIIAGGAVYDHLDFSFTTDRPDGTAVPLPPDTRGGGGPALRRQLSILKQFIENVEFVRMAPNDALITQRRIAGPGAANATTRVLAEAGKVYAIYVAGGTSVEVDLELPAGEYKAEWISTKTGRIEKAEAFHHPGGDRTMVSPAYSEDIALRVNRQ